MTLPDGAIERLRRLADRPDFSATRYEIGDEIGRGGMGLVFRARDRELDRDVAVKITAWNTASDALRLRREARISRRSSTPVSWPSTTSTVSPTAASSW